MSPDPVPATPGRLEVQVGLSPEPARLRQPELLDYQFANALAERLPRWE